MCITTDNAARRFGRHGRYRCFRSPTAMDDVSWYTCISTRTMGTTDREPRRAVASVTAIIAATRIPLLTTSRSTLRQRTRSGCRRGTVGRLRADGAIWTFTDRNVIRGRTNQTSSTAVCVSISTGPSPTPARRCVLGRVTGWATEAGPTRVGRPVRRNFGGGCSARIGSTVRPD